MTDPEDRCAYHQNNNEENSPGVDVTVVLGDFWMIAHEHGLLSVLLVATRSNR
jgi:hypothetical protein